METGERRWHYQVVRHDVWDADIATPLLLYEAEVDGRPRKALAAMRADGYLFVFDRETGEPLVPIEEREVPQDAFLHTAPTQPFPVGAESILPECSFWRDRVPPPFELSCSTYTPPSVDRHLVVAPGAPIPRVRVTPMSFSPATGYVYAQGTRHVGRARRFEDPWLSRPSGGHISLPDSVGIIAAVDPRTSRVVWKQEAPSPLLGSSGPLTTTGGLMFRGSPGGQVEAYDARTGERGGRSRPPRRGRGCGRALPPPTSWPASSSSRFDGPRALGVRARRRGCRPRRGAGRSLGGSRAVRPRAARNRRHRDRDAHGESLLVGGRPALRHRRARVQPRSAPG